MVLFFFKFLLVNKINSLPVKTLLLGRERVIKWFFFFQFIITFDQRLILLL